MCTLTFHPRGSNSYALTSNRDEGIHRPRASLPQFFPDDGNLLMPIDPVGNGSWIGTNDAGRSACLLNGAFEQHTPSPPYAKSRGMVLRECFHWEDPEDFLQNYPLEGIGREKLNIEPFTLVLIGSYPSRWLKELRWDGKDRHIRELDPTTSEVWSAPMLYSLEIRKRTEQRFHRFLQEKKDPADEDLLAFNKGEMYRSKCLEAGQEPIEELRTLSITSISVSPDNSRLSQIILDKDISVTVDLPHKIAPY